MQVGGGPEGGGPHRPVRIVQEGAQRIHRVLRRLVALEVQKSHVLLRKVLVRETLSFIFRFLLREALSFAFFRLLTETVDFFSLSAEGNN